jgi:hypothetical protein
MATNYPGSLDNFTNPTSSNTLDSPSHSLQHADLNDAVEAIETKLGAGSATPGTATALFPLVAGTAGATSWTRLTATGITSGTATSGQVLRADGSGAATWTTPTAGGLVLISTTSITAVSSQAFTSVFTSTYDNYLIDVSLTSVTSGDITLKLRSSTTDSSTNYDYGLAGFGASATARTASGSNAAATLLNRASTATAANRIGFQTIIQKPNLAQPTTFLVTASGTDATGWFGWSGAGCHFASTAYDGFNLIFGGTTTGTLSLYGYSK